MKSFTVDEDAAREWVADLIVAYELSELETPAAAAALRSMPQLGLTWRPREPGQEETISALIRSAHHQPRVLDRPDHAETAIEFVDDGDDWCYRFLLVVAAPLPVTLASPPTEIRHLGDDSVDGVEAAIGILREAEHTANSLVGQLNAFVKAAFREV